MRKVSKTLSLVALCAVMIIMSVVPAFAVEKYPPDYVENHDVVDCINYYKNNGNYYFQVKYPKGMEDYVIVKFGSSDGAGYLSRMLLENTKKYYGIELNYLYSDQYYEYQEIVISCPRDSYQYTWNGVGLKIYYDGDNPSMATNAPIGSMTEGNGYYLTSVN